MEELSLNGQIILYDRATTMIVYATVERGSSDDCSCGGCKNFRQFRKIAYGPDLLALLTLLGVDPQKEWEAYSAGQEIDGHIIYGGWFVFIGEWAQQNNAKDAQDFYDQRQSFRFTDSFPNATKRFGPKTLAVEFNVAIPKAADYVSDWSN